MTTYISTNVGRARPFRRTLLSNALLSLLPAAAFAQATPPTTTLDPVVVTASRSPQPLSSVLADVSVVDRTTIERSGATGVADLLARLPGVEFARSGGPAGTTSVFIRGAESRHTAVYIDGVRVDSQTTAGAMWEQIPLDQIERIEVLRGPAAAIYGSDAIGGVVQLFTRRGEGPARPTVSATIGTYDTQVQAGVSGSAQGFDYSLSASRVRSDGFDARTAGAVGHNPDKDGYRRSSVQARAGFQFNPEHRVEASVLGTDLDSQFDGFTPGFDDVNHHTLRNGTLAWSGKWSPDASTRLQVGQTKATYETQPDFYRTETTLRDYTLQHDQRFGGHHLTAVLERREDKLLNPATAFTETLEGKRHQDALALGWRGDFGAHGLQVHVRHDEDSEFGGKSTGSAAWGWTFVPQWRVTAGVATSFRVPTLYQRFSQYGNPELVPESGRNVELGLRWADAGHEVSLTTWRNKVTNLIAFGPPGPCVDGFGCYVNVGRAQLDGVTLAARSQLGPVALHGSVDWHDPKNADTGLILPRRAKRLATLGAEVELSGWTVGADVQAAGERFENAANTQRLGGYGLVNLFVATTLAPGLTLEGRIDNVADKDYQTARNYATAGRNAQLTLRWALQ